MKEIFKIEDILNKIYNADCIDFMRNIPDNSIDAIITDPPYLYLDHKLDKQFYEESFFKECYRIMKKDSILIFFGRGVAFSKWNCICDNLGFKFKEELIWDKGRPSSPMGCISRQHESISVFQKGNKKLNTVYISKLEYDINSGEIQKTINDLKMLVNKIKNIKTYEDFIKFKSGEFKSEKVSKYKITSVAKYNKDTAFWTYQSHSRGKKLSSILRVNTDHYNYLHPTQKALELMELLVKLGSNENDLVLDPFIGSGTTCIACKNTLRNYIGVEVNKEYFEIAKQRIYGKLFAQN